MSYKYPGPCGCLLFDDPIDDGTLARVFHPPPTWGGRCFRWWVPARKVLSGAYWVTWADDNAKNSDDLEELVNPFKSNVKTFIAALEKAGAKVHVQATRRDAKRAYLFHWSWLIALGKSKPTEALPVSDVDIEWDHGDPVKSKAGADEMVKGFGLAVPPKSKVAPALHSNHIASKAIDMDITWKGDLKIKEKDGKTDLVIAFMKDPNLNTQLHAVGKSYGVVKHTSDAPHWSINGRCGGFGWTRRMAAQLRGRAHPRCFVFGEGGRRGITGKR